MTVCFAGPRAGARSVAGLFGAPEVPIARAYRSILAPIARPALVHFNLRYGNVLVTSTAGVWLYQLYLYLIMIVIPQPGV